MKNVLYAIAVLLCTWSFTSCLKDDDKIQVENVKKGEKWGVRIGSSPEEVYRQIQEADQDKNIEKVSIVYRKASNDPALLPGRLDGYDFIKFERPGAAYMETVYVGIMPEGVQKIRVAKEGEWVEVDSWPEDVPDQLVIRTEDEVADLYGKLVQLYEQDSFKDYQFSFADKPLNRPYDPKVEHYEEWAFSFQGIPDGASYGRTDVRLYFSNRKLQRMQITYNTFDPPVQ